MPCPRPRKPRSFRRTAVQEASGVCVPADASSQRSSPRCPLSYRLCHLLISTLASTPCEHNRHSNETSLPYQRVDGLLAAREPRAGQPTTHLHWPWSVHNTPDHKGCLLTTCLVALPQAGPAAWQKQQANPRSWRRLALRRGKGKGKPSELAQLALLGDRLVKTRHMGTRVAASNS